MEETSQPEEWEMGKQQSSFKLIKNSKGYNWEIKIYSENVTEMKEKTDDLNTWAELKYGKDKNIEP